MKRIFDISVGWRPAADHGRYGSRLERGAIVSGALARRAVKERADLAAAFPARHVVDVQLHELLRQRHGLLLVAQLEDGVAADHFLGLHERPVDDAKLA